MTPAASCFISTRQQHHIQTLPVHQDLIGWVQSGSKTVIQGQQQQTFCSGQLFLLARGQTWDVVNQPDNGAYQALAIQLDPDFVLAFHQRYGSHLQTTTIHSHARLAITPLLAQALNSSHQLLNSTEHSALLQQHRLEEVLLLLAEQGYSFASDAVWTLADKVRQRISLSPHDDWTIERLAHLFHTRRGFRAESMNAAMYCRIAVTVKFRLGVNHRFRLLRAGGAVEISQRPTINLASEKRKIRAYALH